MTKEQRLHSYWSLGMGLLLTVVLILTSAPAEAIPVAGNYLFTSGLSGSFTSNGSSLTAWSIDDLFFNNWSHTIPLQLVPTNEARNFFTHFSTESLAIDWVHNEYVSASSLGLELNAFTITSASTPVPEPNSALLLGLGLLLLLGYGWRQRRQAGMQIG